MCKIECDQESKVLMLTLKKGKSVDSEVKGNVVLDFDPKGELVRLEVMDVNLEAFLKAKETVNQANR